jgi:hypothetical protein
MASFHQYLSQLSGISGTQRTSERPQELKFPGVLSAQDKQKFHTWVEPKRTQLQKALGVQSGSVKIAGAPSIANDGRAARKVIHLRV